MWAPSDGSLISSAAAVAKAIDVLSEYYSSAAFVQVHTVLTAESTYTCFCERMFINERSVLC